MITVKDWRVREIDWQYDECTITLRTKELSEDGQFKFIVQGFVESQDNDLAEFTISAPSEVVERFGKDIFLLLEDDLQTYIRATYLEQYADRVRHGGEQNDAIREAVLNSGTDHGELSPALAAQNGVGP